MLCNKGSLRSEKLVHRNEEQPLLAATRESLQSNEDPARPKINQFEKKKKRDHNTDLGGLSEDSR